jgi:hypothetical protein
LSKIKKEKEKVMPTEQEIDVLRTQVLNTKAVVIKRKYEEQIAYNEDKTGKVSILHDPGLFSPTTINCFLALSKRIGKEVCLVSWPNDNAIAYVKSKMAKRKKVYFFIFGEPELENGYSEPFGNDCQLTRLYTDDAGKTAKYRYWNHEAQLGGFRDYFDVFELSGTGSRISVDDSMYHFNVYPNVAVSLTSFLLGNCPEQLAKYAMQELLNNASSTMRASRTKKDYKKIVSDFMVKYKDFSLASLKRAPDNINYKINDLLERMQNNYRAISTAEREIAENTNLLEIARKNLDNFSAYYESQVGNLEQVLHASFKTKFRDIGFNGYDTIYANTKTIYIDTVIPQSIGGDGTTVKRFMIGDFRISIKINESYVLLQNLNNTIREGSSDHPHVRSGRPCLGNLKEEVPRMIKQSEYIGLFLLMYDFLTSINDHGWYDRITCWKEVPIINQRTIGDIDHEDDEEDEEETATVNATQAQTASQA